MVCRRARPSDGHTHPTTRGVAEYRYPRTNSSATRMAGRSAATSCTLSTTAPRRMAATAAAVHIESDISIVGDVTNCLPVGLQLKRSGNVREAVQIPQNLTVLFLALAHAEAGIDDQALRLKALANRAADARLQLGDQRTGRILQARQLGPVLGLPPHVLDDQPGVVLHHDFRQVRFPDQSGRVLNDLHAISQGPFGDCRLVGLDADGN